MSDITTELRAMHEDASLWSQAAEKVEAPRRAIGDLHLTGADLSMWAVDRNLDRTYENGRVVLEDLLGRAVEAFTGLGDSLRAAAETYQREEEANMHEMNRIMGDR
ncbi:hypothetical protein [Saccharothrix australiensis]|uniref:hypothetical protein n=1 Tax=Saccharothrix australiensis TaxID=2072 RepID=UPI000EAE31C0|nr:hypothetical protein [Saccharothrix australiensis]